MPQTAYSQFPTVALAGQIADAGNRQIVSYPAAEAIRAGDAVEITTVSGVDYVRRPQGTTTSLAFAGVAIYEAAHTPNATGEWQVGDMVPVMTKGRVYANWNGTTQTSQATPNVNHSSTTATNRGAFTDAATSSTAGSEIAAAPSGVKLVRPVSASGLCLVELNLP